MTGGLAWVFDEDGNFLSQTRYHTGFLAPEPLSQLDETAAEELRQLIELHAEKTASTRARWILSDWSNLSARFVRLTPLPKPKGPGPAWEAECTGLTGRGNTSG